MIRYAFRALVTNEVKVEDETLDLIVVLDKSGERIPLLQ